VKRVKSSAALGLVVGLAVAVAIAGCLKTGTPRRITGTCGGACDYYLGCKHNDDPVARRECVVECREVFSDVRSLKAFERLTCKDAIEYVDGIPEQAREARQRIDGPAKPVSAIN